MPGPGTPHSAGGGSAPTFVQEKDVSSFAATTVTVTFGTNVVAGSAIVCMGGWSGAGTLTSLKDGTNANLTSITTSSTAGNIILYKMQSTSGGASASAITLIVSTNASSNLKLLCENFTASSAVDVFELFDNEGFPGTGANAITSCKTACPDKTTTVADACAGFVIDNGDTTDNFTAGTTVAWTLDQNPGAVMHSAEHFVQSASGAIAATFTSANGAGIVVNAALVCLKP